MPHSFADVADGDLQRRYSAIISPFLEAVSDARAYGLLIELLATNAITEHGCVGGRKSAATEWGKGGDNPFTDGMRSACAKLVVGAIDDAHAATVHEGTAVDLWARLCVPALGAGAPDLTGGFGILRGRWSQRLAIVRWVGLPLLMHMPTTTLMSTLLAPLMPQLLDVLDEAKSGHLFAACAAPLASAAALSEAPPAPGAVEAALTANEQLARCILSCEVIGVLMGRCGMVACTALKQGGELSQAAGGVDLFKRMVGLLSQLSMKGVKLPPALGVDLPAAAAATTSPALQELARAQALQRSLHAAAYAAFVESVVQTQTQPLPIEKTILKWGLLWELTTDLRRAYELSATTSFEVTSEASRRELLGGGARVGQARGGSGAAYLPSQALLSSSLTQDASQLDPGGMAAFGEPSAGPGIAARGGARSSRGASQATAASLASLGTDTPAVEPVGEVRVKVEGARGAGTDRDLGDSADADDGDDPDGVVLVHGFELDELSTHPLMAILLRAIAELRRRDLEAPFTPSSSCAQSGACVCGGPSGPGQGMPAWMHALLTTMSKGEAEREQSRRHLAEALRMGPGTTFASDAERAFKEKDEASKRTLNVRLVIARLAYNLTRQEKLENRPVPIFQRYSKLWARLLLRTVLDSLSLPDACFHYLARDIICMLAEWQDAAAAAQPGADILQSTDDVPSSAGAGSGALVVDPLLDDLIERLMGLCGDEKTVGDALSVRELLRENVRVVRLLIERWLTRLHPRRLAIRKLLGAKLPQAAQKELRYRLSGLHLMAALLANDLDAHDDPAWTPHVRVTRPEDTFVPYKPVAAAEIPKALLAQVADVRPPKQGEERKGPQTPRKALYQPAARTLGMVMTQLAGKAGASAASASLLDELERGLMRLLASLQDGTQESLARLLVILDELTSSYPQALLLQNATYGHYAYLQLTRVFGSARVQVLSCLERLVLLEPRAASAAPSPGPTPPSVASAAPMELDDERLGVYKLALKPTELQLVLQQRQAGVQLAALRLVSAMSERRAPMALAPYLGVLNAAFEGHKDRECRALHLRLLMRLRDAAVAATSPAVAPPHTSLGGTPEPDGPERAVDTSAVAAAATSALLRGLSDPDDGRRCERCTREHGMGGGRPVRGCTTCDAGLREEVTLYWHAHALDKKLSERLVSCFSTLHTAEVESRWLHHCGALLLQLPLDSPNAERLLFKKPLQEGLKFTAVHAVPTSASSSAAMRPWGSQFFSQSQDGSDGSFGGPLRATQSQLLFSQTQTQAGGAANAIPSTYSTQDEGSGVAWGASGAARMKPPVPLFPPSATQGAGSQGSESAPLMGKRFKASSSARRAEAAGDRAAVAAMRLRALAASNEKRGTTVAAFRTYRTGELPDIQICPRDLLLPLRALVQHDTLVAKLTFTQLFRTAQAEQLCHDPQAMERLHAGVVELLRGGQGGTAFVGCLHELALAELEVGSPLEWLPPELVASSAKQSGNLHSGILLLEHHLVAAGGVDVERPSKRSRATASSAASSAPGSQLEFGIKMALADLYRAIGDEDVVRGISVEVATTEHVRRALAAETAGDASEALKHYEAAVDGSAAGAAAGAAELTAWETELTSRGALHSRALLARWVEVANDTRAAMTDACTGGGGGDGKLAFHGSLSEPWVQLWITSHAKADSDAQGIGGSWGRWPTAEVDAQRHPTGAPQPQRDATKLLEAGHGSLLLLDRMASDDLNGVRALLPRCVHAFVRRWMTLHPLAEAARLKELEPLQILCEVAEVTQLLEVAHPLVEVASAAGEWARSPAYTALLHAWALRTPSPTHHNTCTWDTQLCARRRMLATMRGSLAKAVSERRAGRSYIDAATQSRLLSEFDADAHRCMLRLFEAAATATREQGNYAAAEMYLKRAAPIRQNLGESPDAPAFVCSLFRLTLQRAKARNDAGSDLWRETLAKVHMNAERLAAKLATTSDVTVDDGCELRALRATVAWELAASQLGHHTGNASLSSAPPPSAPSDGSVEALMAQAYGWLKQNANEDGRRLPKARQAAMRLELVDLCNRAIGLHEEVAPASKAELALVATEQVGSRSATLFVARSLLIAIICHTWRAPRAWRVACATHPTPPSRVARLCRALALDVS